MFGKFHSVLLLCFIRVLAARKSQKLCGEDSWFKHGYNYTYTYEATAESSYVGMTKSKAAVQISCRVNVEVPKKCGATMKLRISKCSLLQRDQGEEENYKLLQSSDKFSWLISRYHVEFYMKDGLVHEGKITVEKNEPLQILNIKRGIISVLQLKFQTASLYDKPIDQVEIFGSCPVNYKLSKQKGWTIHTNQDLTECSKPCISKRQFTLTSLIKTLSGGYEVTNFTELVYPFDSSYECEYYLKNKHIESASCIQNQSFRPLAHQGSVYATAMLTISQTLKKVEEKKFKPKYALRHLTKTKTVQLPFEFEKEQNIASSKTNITDKLNEVVTAYQTNPITVVPDVFYKLVTILKRAEVDTLNGVADEIWKDANTTDSVCVKSKLPLHQRFLVDGLMSCGSTACVHAMVTNVEKRRLCFGFFLKDLGLNYQPNENILLRLLKLCKKNGEDVCLPLSILADRHATNSNNSVISTSSPIYQTLETFQQALEHAYDSQKENSTGQFVWILKGLANMGRLIRTGHDPATQIGNRLLLRVLNCAKNTNSLYVRKTALRTLSSIAFDSRIEEGLGTILSEVAEPVDVRIEAFLVLARYERPETVKRLTNILKHESIEQLRTYMESYVGNILESEDPGRENLQKLWKKAVTSDKELLRTINKPIRWGQSKYIEVSRYFGLPLTKIYFGGQMELSVLYRPSSLIPYSIGFKAKTRMGETITELVEIILDIEGLETIFSSIYSTRGQPLLQRIMGLIQYLSQASIFPHKEGGWDFSFNEETLLNKIKEILTVANFTTSSPQGYIHIKILGYNIATWNVRTVLHYIRLPNLKVLLQDWFHDLHLIMIHSGVMLDINKVIPSAIGVPINKTIGITQAFSLNVNNNLNIEGNILPPKNITNEGEVQLSAAGSLFAQLAITVPEAGVYGLKTYCHMTGYAGISGNVEITSSISPKSKLFHWNAKININNIEEPVDLLKIRSGFSLLHAEIIEHIKSNTKQIDFHRCTAPSTQKMTGRSLCLEFMYPDVFESTKHPYFPIAGPLKVDLYLTPVDTELKQFQIEINRQVKNLSKTEAENMRSVEISLRAPGKNLTREVNIKMLHNISNNHITVLGSIPEANSTVVMDFYQIDEPGKYDLNIYITYKDQTNSKEKYAVKINVIKKLCKDDDDAIGCPILYNKDHHIFINILFALPGASLTAVFDSKRCNNNVNTLDSSTINCNQTGPLLYQFDINLNEVDENGQTTRIQLKNDAKINAISESEWQAVDILQFTSPGQNLTSNNTMQGNFSYAIRNSNIVWTIGKDTIENIKMYAYAYNRSKSGLMNYYYQMHLEHLKKFDVEVNFELIGDGTDFRFMVDLNYNAKAKTDDKCLRSSESRNTKGNKHQRPKNTLGQLTPTASSFKPAISRADVKPQDQSKNSYQSILQGIISEEPMKWDITTTLVMHIEPILPNALAGYRYGCNISCQSNSLDFKLASGFDLKKEIHYKNNPNWVLNRLINKNFNGRLNFRFDRLGHHVLDLDEQFLFNESFDRKKLLILKSNISSDMWPHFSHDFKMEADLDGCPFYCKSLELSHRSTFIHKYMDSNVTINYSHNPAQVKFHKKHNFVGKHPFITSINIDSNFYLNSSLPNLSISLELPNKSLQIEGQAADPYHFNITIYSLLKQASPKKIYAVNWLLTLEKSSYITHKIVWNPKLTETYMQWTALRSQKLRWHVLNTINIFIENLQKNYSDMILPISGMTIGKFSNKYIYANFRELLPLLSNVTAGRSLSDIALENYGVLAGMWQQALSRASDNIVGQHFQSLRYGIHIALQTFLRYLQERLNKYPRFLKYYIEKIAKPAFYQMISESKLQFTMGHPFIWETFTTLPQLTRTQKFVLNWLYRPSLPVLKSCIDRVAVLFGDNWISTFDGWVYKLPEFSKKCSHLLAADVIEKSFALFKQHDTMTLLFKQMFITMDSSCKVFLNSSNKALELPYKCLMGNFYVKMDDHNVILKTKFGLTVICDPKAQMFIVSLAGTHHDHSMGLLGTNDDDIGTEMKLPSGNLDSNFENFLNAFEISTISKCQIKDSFVKDIPDLSCIGMIKEKCQTLFGSYISPLLHCFQYLNPSQFINACVKNVKHCDEIGMKRDLCKIVSAYISQCRASFSINFPPFCGHCEEGNDQLFWNKTVKKESAEIVVIVDQYAFPEKKNKIIEYFHKFFSRIKLPDLHLGLVAYGGKEELENPNVYTFKQRYFGSLSDFGNVLNRFSLEGFQQNSNFIKDALRLASSYPFRTDVTKMIFLVANEEALKITTNLEVLASHLKKNDIILNIFSNAEVLKSDNLYAVTWNNEYIKKKKHQVDSRITLPKNEYADLIKATKGSLIAEDMLKKPLVKVIKHIETQMSTSNCRQCHCDTDARYWLEVIWRVLFDKDDGGYSPSSTINKVLQIFQIFFQKSLKCVQ